MTGHTLVGTTLRERTAEATTNVRLRGALARATARFGEHRLAALATLEDPDGLRRAARAIKADVIARLPELLEQFADNVDRAAAATSSGRPTAPRPTATSLSVAKRIGARTVVKSSRWRPRRPTSTRRSRPRAVTSSRPTSASGSSSSPHHTPSHIIAPAVHLDRYQVATSCRREVDRRPRARRRARAPRRLRPRAAARRVPRAPTSASPGCNFGVAETGSIVLVDERGQRSALHDGAPRAHRGHGHGADRRGLGAARPVRQPARPLRHRPAPVVVHEHHHRARAARARPTGPTSCTS